MIARGACFSRGRRSLLPFKVNALRVGVNVWIAFLMEFVCSGVWLFQWVCLESRFHLVMNAMYRCEVVVVLHFNNL